LQLRQDDVEALVSTFHASEVASLPQVHVALARVVGGARLQGPPVERPKELPAAPPPVQVQVQVQMVAQEAAPVTAQPFIDVTPLPAPSTPPTPKALGDGEDAFSIFDEVDDEGAAG